MAQETEPGPDPSPRNRKLRVALVLSLALNLMFLGILAGGALQSARAPGPAADGADLRALIRVLPDEVRRDLRASMRPAQGERAHPGRDARRVAGAGHRLQLVTLLRADPFDAEAFAALLEAGQAAREIRARAALEALVERIAALPPAQRAAMADRLDRRGERPER